MSHVIKLKILAGEGGEEAGERGFAGRGWLRGPRDPLLKSIGQLSDDGLSFSADVHQVINQLVKSSFQAETT